MGVGLSTFPEREKRDTYKLFWEKHAQHKKFYDKYVHVREFEEEYDKSTTAVGDGDLEEKSEWEDIAQKTPKQGYTTLGKVRDFSKMQKISYKVYRSKLKLRNFLKSQTGKWLVSYIRTMEKFFARVINRGGYLAGDSIFNNHITNILEDPQGDLCYDGKPVFALSGNDRSSKGGGTYFNGYALPFNQTNLETLTTHMSVDNAKDEEDGEIVNEPNMLLANPFLRWRVAEVLESELRSDTANNATNAVNDLIKPLFSPYFTDTDQWTLLDFIQEDDIAAIECLMRQNPEFDMWEEKKSKCYFMSIFASWGLKFNDWRPLISSNFSTS
jgi:hypothetical protein